MVRAVYQPRGGASSLHARLRVSRRRAGRARLVRRVSVMVAVVLAPIARVFPARTCDPVPVHLLLLSRRILQGVCDEAAHMRGARCANELSRRKGAAPFSEPAPLHALRRAAATTLFVGGGVRGVLTQRPLR